MEGSFNTRTKALQRVALLTTTPQFHKEALYKSGVRKLQNAFCPRNGATDRSASLSHAPMTFSELEVLLALCEAAPLIQDVDSSERLLNQLSPYLLEAQTQAIAPSPLLRSLESSPWEILGYSLMRAILSIGIRHPNLHDAVIRTTLDYLRNCLRTVNSVTVGPLVPERNNEYFDIEDTLTLATVSVSLLGSLEALSLHAHFYHNSELCDTIALLRQIFDENLMVSVEGVFSSIRTSDSNVRAVTDWKFYSKRYATAGRPLGAMLLQCGFMKFLVTCSSLQLASVEQLHQTDTLDLIIADADLCFERSNVSDALLDLLSEIAVESMHFLEDGADYLQLGSAWQRELAYAVKAHSIHTFLNCAIVDEDATDIDALVSWLEDAIADPAQMASEKLSYVVLYSMAALSRSSPSTATNFSRSLPRFVVQSGIRGESVTIAARSLTFILQRLSQDSMITGLYSLGNVLSARSRTDKAIGSFELANGNTNSTKSTGNYTQHSSGSAISLDLSNEEETATTYGKIVKVIVEITANCRDEKITALAQSMLLQKLGRLGPLIDFHIIEEAAKLATAGGPTEFRSLLKLYTRLGHEAIVNRNSSLSEAVRNARLFIANSLVHESALLPIFLRDLFEMVVTKGDVHESEKHHQVDVDLAAQEIVELLPPLATLLSVNNVMNVIAKDEFLARLHREAWFNFVLHDITPNSTYGQFYVDELRIFAVQAKSLIPEDRADQLESDIELNTVLRRGMNGPNTAVQKKRLISVLPRCESDIRSLSYAKVIFLRTAYVVETLRAQSGDCSHILTYFLDPSLSGSAMEHCMRAIAEEVMSMYIRKSLTSPSSQNSAPKIAEQLAAMFTGCCSRIPRVQQIATSCADKIIHKMPSSLCQKSSLFALLELLDIMWTSCLEADLDEYRINAFYASTRGKVSVELSDDYVLRRDTLNNLYKRGRDWILAVINIAPLDVKGLLQTYLSEYNDEGGYGHVSLGRSFALDMGSAMPTSDQRLGAIDLHGDLNITTGSDFIAQYTTRQEYRHADAPRRLESKLADSLPFEDKEHVSAREVEDVQPIMACLQRAISTADPVPIENLRDILRRNTALLCKSEDDQCAIVQYLVRVPFAAFTKQSIKLGISLWLGVINENPRMESRVLAVIAENWGKTVQNRAGVFSERLRHLDPFYIKEEFAPSEKAELIKRQQVAHHLIAPHLRLLHFLRGHFNASRLGTLHSQQIFRGIAMATLEGLRESSAHPLAREFFFQAALFGLDILRYCAGLDQVSRWRLKDTILSAALSWFSHPPRWSYGGNRLQIKAEVRLLADVEAALTAVSSIFAKTTGCLSSLFAKQDLLHILLENERTRLEVWLYPLDHEKRHVFSPAISSRIPSETVLASLLDIAWTENSSLAIHLTNRFASSGLVGDIRTKLVNHPEIAIEEPDALQLLIGSSLPGDLSTQLRCLLYWAPINPVTAVTYFLPEFRNNPFIVQYAIRALESHSVDVTFFYVPQIVQTLRYDVLGYVQRYIIETAKFSQLFAHQIIWNMKANAYKDEDSSIEDSLKPTLDIVRERMTASFSGDDRAFYEREFNFFNEITGISGKLRPYIKKSKPEKKQKIEEELRQIKVEVGVYLPSNPDGTLVGIDRKSGKPLQSHAKAPYMATFRIEKSTGGIDTADKILGDRDHHEETENNESVSQESTYEVWQSAIFKVGDDCRQDVLALQMIAAFRGIFNNVGLDVYVYPYRVTATAPGCGVIDVLPNSISRDMLGREAVNGLYDYFISKYGAETSIKFQEARNNFVKSMAAYSVISYLLQFKDRHNGNIMIDDAGHILHIDFGFCFDIAPGGVKFERAPFKLTSEMVAVMGGSTSSQSYRWFEELCVKAFLACRQHTEKLCHIVVLMLGSGLPCFKPETIAHLRQRFVLEKSEREAADFMRDLIKKSHSSYSTKGYDQFQLLTNGIPY